MSFNNLLLILIGLAIGLFFGTLITYFWLSTKREHPLNPILQPSPAQKEELDKFLQEQYDTSNNQIQ